MTRARELARNVVLGVTTAAAMLTEDPALLTVQAARRLPAAVTRRVVAVLRGTAHGRRRTAHLALAAWLGGHRDEARRLLPAALDARPLRRVLAEVAVELDVPLDRAPVAPVTAARAAWRAGDVDEAVRLADGTALERRLTSEVRTMTPGHRPAPPRTARPTGTARPTRTGGPTRTDAPADGPRALHLLTNSLPRTTSGYALRSHAVLRAQAAAGVTVTAATRVGYPVTVGLLDARDVDVVDDVQYRRLLPWTSARTPEARLTQQADLVADLAAAWRPTVLHTTTHYVNALVARAVAEATGLPWVYEVRGVLEDTWAASFPTPQARDAARRSRRHALLRAREAELAATADHVVVLGATVRDHLVTGGVDPARITVVPNSVDRRLLDLDVSSTQARHTLGLPPGGFWVGTVTSLVEYEGIDVLVQAVADLRGRGVDAHAAIVGDGVARPAVARRVTELGLAGHVVMPGRVPAAAATTWYQALDAFVVPRRDTAVTRTVVPLKPMQAMALGRPVVASDLPALAEIVGEPGGGLLVAPEDVGALTDALERVATEDGLAARLGDAGRAFAATRTWEAAGTAYREMYEGLAA